jgi:hypothetical protein
MQVFQVADAACDTRRRTIKQNLNITKCKINM